ncbi:NAD(P)-dependent dehydrogenase, short-chain alcohol dehydrogenase family [Chitinophaga sp. YR627]|uniref:SDR family oxidoreductase n=1 Tax=Chitinophaga sp. YR627 TaxID=1881041 RepID=UPI0008EC5913|nr:SDR family oxidoreductase [Chitinophaga sp. YR627]SFM81030.1 NAD(P)-dependent dehydrogenase, short-chain alcohol dehydrogenase family [Chitinophaga sp. YR627]
MAKKLNNKVALVTGGSAGIGLAIAKLFAAEGAKVIITGRRESVLNDAVTAIGNGALGIQADSSSLSDLDRLYKTIGEKVGKIDILVANAAVYVLAPLAAFTEEMFDKQSNINFKGTFFTVQKSLNYLNDGASVILLSSIANEIGVPNHSSYSATKAAIRSLGRSFAAELVDRGIRVNVLTPGPIDTPVFEQVSSSQADIDMMKSAMAAMTAVKRIGQPEEIAAGALFLASDDASFMIGAELTIDGGIKSL